MVRNIYVLLIFMMIPAFSYAQEPMKLPVDKTPLVIETNNGKIEYDVEIAQRSDEREQGLMYRNDFPLNRAMLFKFNTISPVSMWMANTPLPLDMVFLNDKGIVVSLVENTVPFSHSVISSTFPALYVIELNAGQIKYNKLAVGQRVIHPEIN